eukprot:7165514-Ditylum_brightwellii.AAC.1
MQEMIATDRDVIISANTGHTTWTSSRDLPVGEAFNRAFAMKQKMHNNKSRIIMYVEVKTSWKWKGFEGDKGIYKYLRQNNIFLQMNQFDSEETGIVGYLLDLHGKLVRKEDLVLELTIELATIKTTD